MRDLAFLQSHNSVIDLSFKRRLFKLINVVCGISAVPQFQHNAYTMVHLMGQTENCKLEDAQSQIPLKLKTFFCYFSIQIMSDYMWRTAGLCFGSSSVFTINSTSCHFYADDIQLFFSSNFTDSLKLTELFVIK